MKRNALMIEAFGLIVLQIFLLFLPAYRVIDNRPYDRSCESYTAIQMVINHSDTIHDPSLDINNRNDAKLINDSRSNNFLMVAAMILAISGAVSTFALESDTLKKGFLCMSTLLLGCIPLIEGSFLNNLYRESEKITANITFLGILQVLLAFVTIIMIVAIPLYQEKCDEYEKEQEIIRRLKESDERKWFG